MDEQMSEQWVAVAGFEGYYEISSLGRVRSVDRIDTYGRRRSGKFMKPSKTRKGYLTVGMARGGVAEGRYIHRMVASAFIANPDNKPQVNHIDGVMANNHVSNLEWATVSENQLHACYVLQRGVRPIVGVSVADGSRVQFASLEHAVSAGFVRANIQKCIAGVRKKHRGYTWADAALVRGGT